MGPCVRTFGVQALTRVSFVRQIGDFQEAFDVLGVLPEVLAEGGVDLFVSGAQKP